MALRQKSSRPVGALRVYVHTVRVVKLHRKPAKLVGPYEILCGIVAYINIAPLGRIAHHYHVERFAVSLVKTRLV